MQSTVGLRGPAGPLPAARLRARSKSDACDGLVRLRSTFHPSSESPLPGIPTGLSSRLPGVAASTPASTEMSPSAAVERPAGRDTAPARDRIIAAAYQLFATRGIRAVGVNEVIARAGVAKATLYKHFRSKDDLVLAFLDERERRWTRDEIQAEATRRGSTPRERLLAIFDVFDAWFQRRDFEGCSFINVLLETADVDHVVGRESAARLANIRAIVKEFAQAAGLRDPEAFSHSWHILMKGSIVAAAEGDRLAAQRAKAMGRMLIAAHDDADG